MPTTNLSQRVKRIVNLSDRDVNDLEAMEVVTEDDLRYLEFEDLPVTLPLVKRRKLHTVCKYLGLGHQLNATIQLDEVRTVTMLGNGPRTAPVAPGAGAVVPVAPMATSNEILRGAPKVHTNPLPDFSGDPVDFEEWDRKAGALIKQSGYKAFIDRPADPENAVEVARSQELFNMILSCVGDGHALNTVEKCRDENDGKECGHAAWKALGDWYLDDTQRDTMISHWESKLAHLTLDKDTTATQFINEFEMYVRKLVKLNEVWSDEKMVREFKDRISDEDYDLESRVHEGTFAELVSKTRKRERDLDRKSAYENSLGKRQRRFARDDGYQEQSKGNEGGGNSDGKKKAPYIPFIPKFLLNSFDSNGRKNLVKWRTLTNRGETMGQKDMAKTADKNSDSDEEKPTKKKKKTKQEKVNKQRRVTKQRRVGLADDSVEVKLASSDEEYSTVLSSLIEPIKTYRDDSHRSQHTGHSRKEKEKSLTMRMVKRSTSVGMSNGRNRHQPFAIIDPGCEGDMIGGVGWHILHFSNSHPQALKGALPEHGQAVLPTVDAVTAVEDEKGKVILMGVGKAAYDRRTTQHESLLNSHHLREHGVIVEDKAIWHGGEQVVKMKDNDGNLIKIPLKFVGGDTMRIALRKPTQEELMALRVIWVLPPMEELTPQSIRRSKRDFDAFQLQTVENDVQESIPEEEKSVLTPDTRPEGKGTRTVEEWKALLAYPSEKVIEKTLDATTQLQVGPVESERREIPRQHRKKRLHMLHPRRLPGRTDADTVFSTVKSIRGYKCVQFFCHVPSDFLFARCLQRESQSHGAYQDYIREVGASDTICTDNSKTQTGLKWEATSREVMTKQRTFVPHNQNQNKVERRIQDVKHKTTLLLQRSGAPLEFWCYALCYVVDCLNHIAKESLNWKTSFEVLNGDTPDLSPFRFRFWEPVKFYSKSGFPEGQWVMARFIGIAWESGDQFTFKVWSEPKGTWKGGREFVRNVVQRRSDICITPHQRNFSIDLPPFRFKRKSLSRKRNGTFQYEMEEIPELPEDNDGESGAMDVAEDSIEPRAKRVS